MRDQTVLVTGGSGSLGHALIAELLAHHEPRRVIVFSDTESNQTRMKAVHPPSGTLDYFIGNVRDYDRLVWAFRAGVDLVIHAAAMKEVQSCEYDWPEAVATNVDGSRNVALAAVECGVPRAILVSTDKAVEAYTEYGKTKAMAESWFIRTNIRAASRGHQTRLGVIRYGNVISSRASVIPLFQRCRAVGDPLPVTDPNATRFFWHMPEAVQAVLDASQRLIGGEIWVPKLQSCRLSALAHAIAPGQPMTVIGLRGKEKLHEVLISEDESRNTWELPKAYVILPNDPLWPVAPPVGAVRVPQGFRYSSDLDPREVQYQESA